MKNRLGILLIVAGILLALFPLGDRIYTWYFQSKALESYEALDFVCAPGMGNNLAVKVRCTLGSRKC